MTIAVHFPFSDKPTEIISDYHFNCFLHLADTFADHHFIFIFNKVYGISLKKKNITTVIATPQIKNRLLEHYFFNYKLPRLLRRYKVSVFVSTGVCSLHTRLPQCLIVRELPLLQTNNSLSLIETKYLIKYSKLFFTKAKSILVVNSQVRELLERAYPLTREKVTLTTVGIPLNPETNEDCNGVETKKDIVVGANYFVCIATRICEKNIIAILKGFSIFKKWQQSEMKLVILFPSITPGQIPGLDSYKYQSEVMVIASVDKIEINSIITAAYAAIYLPHFEITEVLPLHALALQVPLITADSLFYKAFFKDAAVYTSEREKDISEKLMLLYKDEYYRKEIISKGSTLAATHDVERTANQLWQCIRVTAEK